MTTRARRLNIAAAVALMGAGVLTLPACSTSKHAGNEQSIRRNPTPVLSTRTSRKQDRFNSLAYMRDTQWRMFHEDMARTFYYDRPSRLVAGPKPY